MADREKVISELELAASLAWDSDEGQCEIMDSDDALTVAHAIRDALELLKDQKSVKPAPGMLCGECGCRIYQDANYCYNCGRPVKWDD